MFRKEILGRVVWFRKCVLSARTFFVGVAIISTIHYSDSEILMEIYSENFKRKFLEIEL